MNDTNPIQQHANAMLAQRAGPQSTPAKRKRAKSTVLNGARIVETLPMQWEWL